MSFRRRSKRDTFRNPVTDPIPGDDSDPEGLFETVVSIGERIIADEDENREYQPVWEQVVTDEQGRRRFHGAFTGGFSAGYFNTVGSKEGWTPSEFHSSRNKDKDGHAMPSRQQRPEDFMDDEDKAMLGKGRTLSTTTDFQVQNATTSTTSTFDSRIAADVGAGDRALLSMMIEPAKDGAGVRLLKKMGWREGQGIGPRRRFPLAASSGAGQSSSNQKRVLGPTLPPGLEAARDLASKTQITEKDKDEDIITDDITTTAPAERIPLLSDIPVKNNRFGMGFIPPTLMDLVSIGHGSGDGKVHHGEVGSTGNSTTKRQAGFGVGVFEEEDYAEYEDEPIDVNAHRKELYDIDLSRNDDPHDSKMNPKMEASVKSAQDAAERQSQFSRDVDIGVDAKGAVRRCLDGELLPPGFVFERPIGVGMEEKSKFDSGNFKAKWYPPPQVPTGYIARHTFAADAPTPESLAPHLHMVKLSIGSGGRRNLSAKQRGDMLGEASLPVTALSSDGESGSGSGSEKLIVPPPSVWDLLKPEDRDMLQSLKSQYTEAKEMKEKREHERVKRMLEVGADDVEGEGEDGKGKGKDGKSAIDGYGQERKLLTGSDSVTGLEHMSGLLASRFTESTASASVPTQKTATATDTVFVDDGPSKYANAAKMGMFGRLTRSIEPFEPSRMLCRRLDVPVPKKSVRYDEVELHFEQQREKEREMEKERKKMAEDLEEEEIENGIETEVERPHIDLFKAIFLDSDSEDDDDEPNKKKDEVTDADTARSIESAVTLGALNAAKMTKPPTDKVLIAPTWIQTSQQQQQQQQAPPPFSTPSLPEPDKPRGRNQPTVPKPQSQPLIKLSDNFSSSGSGHLHFPVSTTATSERQSQSSIVSRDEDEDIGGKSKRNASSSSRLSSSKSVDERAQHRDRGHSHSRSHDHHSRHHTDHRQGQGHRDREGHRSSSRRRSDAYDDGRYRRHRDGDRERRREGSSSRRNASDYM